MNLDNIAEKTPKERIKAIREFEEASRRRSVPVMEACKKARERLKNVYKQVPKWAGVSVEDIKETVPAKVHLNEKDQKAFDELKRIVDRISSLKLKEIGALEKGSKVGTATRKRQMTKV